MAVRRPLVRIGGKNTQLPAGDTLVGQEGFFRVEPTTATATGQTVFTVPGGYTPGAVIVSLNGATLPPADYTATNGTTVVLASGSGIVAGSVLLVYVLSAFEVADALPLGGTAKDSERFAGLLPPPEDGKQYALKDGAWVEVEASGGGSDLPVLTPGWALSRASIGDGYAAQDGQLLSRTTYPDAWAQAQAIGMVITEAEWQADPLKRAGYFSSGDGSTTFRLPDPNGKQAGSLGAVFLRGDGALSAGQAGLIQRDAFQGHRFQTPLGGGSDIPANWEWGLGEPVKGVAGSAYRAGMAGAYTSLPTADGVSGTPRTAPETRALNLTVVWTIKLFGAVVNVGSADAAQLASDYANLAGRVSALESIGKPLTKEFVSAPQAITLGGTVTVAHGLGVKPKLIRLVAICTTVDGAYVVGSERELAPYMEYLGQGVGCEAESSDTQIVVRFGNTAIFPTRSGATVAYATVGRWQLRVEAMA